MANYPHYRRPPYPNELYHHGILGMKWGVRNGPPYPLGVEDHNRAEEKAGWQKSLSGGKAEKAKSRSSVSRVVTNTVKVKNETGSEESSKSNKGSGASGSVGSAALDKMSEAEQRKYAASHGAALLAVDPDQKSHKPSTTSFFKEHKKEILIGAAAVAVIAVGAVVVKKQLDKKSIANAELDGEALEFMMNRAKLGLDGEGKAEFNGFASNSEKYVAAWLASDSKRYAPMTEAAYQHMDNTSTLLQSGASMFRVSKGSHDSLRDLEYVSFGDDRDRYVAFLPKIWKANGQTVKKMTELELTAATTIKAPGKKETFDIYEAAMAKMYPKWSTKTTHDMALKQFNRFYANLASFGRGSGDISDFFFEEARSRGYNAVVDFNDAGRLAEKPLILLNANKDAGISGSRTLSYNKDVKEAFDNIKTLSGQDNFSLEDFTMFAEVNPQYIPFVKILLG